MCVMCMGTSCLHCTGHTRSSPALGRVQPGQTFPFEQCFDSLPFLPSHPGTVHSAKNILEDISNMFDDLADQLDAMLD